MVLGQFLPISSIISYWFIQMDTTSFEIVLLLVLLITLVCNTGRAVVDEVDILKYGN